jgi:hypothetical protein
LRRVFVREKEGKEAGRCQFPISSSGIRHPVHTAARKEDLHEHTPNALLLLLGLEVLELHELLIIEIGQPDDAVFRVLLFGEDDRVRELLVDPPHVNAGCGVDGGAGEVYYGLNGEGSCCEWEGEEGDR